MNCAISPFPGRFVHGINLGDWYPCWNFTLSGRLFSADFLALVDPSFAFQKRIADISMAELRQDPHCFAGTMTPRAMWYVWAAAIVRAGGHVGFGQTDTRWLPRENLERIKVLGDIELEFEEFRRSFAPTATTRLGCIWVAEDTPTGAANIRSMLGADTYLATVTIPAAAGVTKADRGWFDAYCRERKQEYAKNYWSSASTGNAGLWEYLVDGVIESADPAQLQYIREHGAKAF